MLSAECWWFHELQILSSYPVSILVCCLPSLVFPMCVFSTDTPSIRAIVTHLTSNAERKRQHTCGCISPTRSTSIVETRVGSLGCRCSGGRIPAHSICLWPNSRHLPNICNWKKCYRLSWGQASTAVTSEGRACRVREPRLISLTFCSVQCTEPPGCVCHSARQNIMWFTGHGHVRVER